MLFGHGSDLYKFDNKIIADFSSNVWYKGMPNALIEHLKDKISSIVHYPSPNAGELAQEISNLYSLSSSNILITNGATEAFYLIAQLFHHSESYIFYPSFAEYEDAAKTFHHQIKYIPNSELHSTLIFNENSLVWIGNPNNPDGKVISTECIKSICINNKRSHFIIDEAYADLFDGFESSISLLNYCPNLLIVRSLTKTFAIPGIRLGYIISSIDVIKKLQDIKMPWSVNTLAIEAGLFILSDYQNRLPNTKEIATQSKKFQVALSQLSGLSVHSSSGNYFLVKLEKGTAQHLKSYLIENHGILVRDASNFKGLNHRYFRLSLQDDQYNAELIRAIKLWISNL